VRRSCITAEWARWGNRLCGALPLQSCGTRRYQKFTSTSNGDRCRSPSFFGGELTTCGARFATAIAPHGDGEPSGAELIGNLLDALRLRFLPWGVSHGVHGNQIDVRAAPAQE
jgi:hypothetical protein